MIVNRAHAKLMDGSHSRMQRARGVYIMYYMYQSSSTIMLSGVCEFGGLEWWNGTVEWSTGLDYWSATPTNIASSVMAIDGK